MGRGAAGDDEQHRAVEARGVGMVDVAHEGGHPGARQTLDVGSFLTNSHANNRRDVQQEERRKSSLQLKITEAPWKGHGEDGAGETDRQTDKSM